VLGLERLREEIGPIVDGPNEWDRDALLLDELTNEEVAPLNVFGFGVELRVVSDRDASLVVHTQLGGERVGVAEFLLISA
jgi:hypothetical protein